MSLQTGDSPSYRGSVIVFLCLSLVVVIAAFYTLRNLAADQSHQQQQSISPVFKIIEEELLAPLQVARTLADAGVYRSYFEQDNPDSDTLTAQLSEYESTFGLTFYLAHDASKTQFNSDGSQFPLVEGDVWWYFALQDDPNDVLAVLGKQEDIHLYIDVKQYNSDGEFAGFAGVGKRLNSFLDVFETYKSKYGHDFIFVNNNNEIVLSSKQELLPVDFNFITLNNLPWYSDFVGNANNKTGWSHLLNSPQGDVLVSSFHLESLDWDLFVVTPLASRQNTLNKTFMMYVILTGVLFLVSYKLIKHLLDLYYQRMSRRFNIDPLTHIPNRLQLENEFVRHQSHASTLSLIVLDVDDFKSINDTFGHNSGDRVLISIAKTLTAQLSNDDIVARWGGEEFVILLINKNLEQSYEGAERCRKALTAIEEPSPNWQITASFGVAVCKDPRDSLSVVFESADKAMYEAKKSGKNRTCIDATNQ